MSRDLVFSIVKVVGPLFAIVVWLINSCCGIEDFEADNKGRSEVKDEGLEERELERDIKEVNDEDWFVESLDE
jgi:hypothetical protein